MFHPSLFRCSILAGMALAATAAQAQQPQEEGRVISSTPVIQQVAVPRQVCSNQPVAVPQQKSGAGAAIGAIAGGAMGNAIGNGSGRAAATILGVFGGAILGDRIEGAPPSQVQNVQQCSTQTFYENRTVAYNVVYEYAGKQYSVQMPNDPGPYVKLQITPVSSAVPLADAPPAVVASAAPAPGAVIQQGVVVVPAPSPVVYARPYYQPYYPPVSFSVDLGYYRGYGHHGHWR
ncbi:MAG: glycine zipper 2TM domain-containing protein [Ramlibacter sp.]|nr:glycine zipper 2TM domain-containing protein [Ramlibacter sp.]